MADSLTQTSHGQMLLKQMRQEKNADAQGAMDLYRSQARENFERNSQMRQLQTSRASTGSSDIFGNGGSDRNNNAALRKPQPPQQSRDNIFHTDGCVPHGGNNGMAAPHQSQDNIFHTDGCVPHGGNNGLAAAYHGGRPSLASFGENHEPAAAFGLQLRTADARQSATTTDAAPTSARALRARRNQVGGLNGGAIGTGVTSFGSSDVGNNSNAADRWDAMIASQIESRARKNPQHRSTKFY